MSLAGPPHTDQAHILWAGGYLDGEGYFSQRVNSSEIVVDGINPCALHRLASILGGSVRPQGRRPGKRQSYRWRLCGDRAREACFLLLARGALAIKGPEAEAIAYSKI